MRNSKLVSVIVRSFGSVLALCCARRKKRVIHLFFSVLVLTTLLLATLLLSHFDFDLLIEKVKGSIFLHALRALLSWLGVNIPIFLLLPIVTLVGDCSLHMNDPAGVQSAAEQPSNPSSGESSQASVNQQPVIHELQPDDARRTELFEALSSRLIEVKITGESLQIMDRILAMQEFIEKSVHGALLDKDYHPESVLEKRHQIRGLMFYPNGEALSPNTYAQHLKEIIHSGTLHSTPYRRIERAIRNSNLFLD